MKVAPGQLSLLTPEGEAPNTAAPSSTETKRQAATADDKPVETVKRRRPRSAQPTPDGATLLTTGEAANLLHVHPRTVQRLVERGQLCAVHLGSAVRFDPRDVTGLIEQVKRRPTSPPTDYKTVRGGRRAAASFGERLRSRQHEHRAAQA